jgi:hypothetical protein
VKGCRQDCRLALRFDPDLFLALVGLAAGGFYMTMIVHPPYRAIARLVDHVLTTTREIDDLGAELACRRSDARGHAPDGDVN